MTTPTHKRAGRPRENDGMITRPIAMTPEQWATAEAIGTTYAQGTRTAIDMVVLLHPILESVREVERSLNWDAAEAMTDVKLVERLAYYLSEAGIYPTEDVYSDEYGDEQAQDMAQGGDNGNG